MDLKKEIKVSPLLFLSLDDFLNTVAVVVAMSGGVDSSVAATIMAKSGCDLSAVFMRNWDKRDESGTDVGCQWEKDWEDVQRVCTMLDIPVKMIDLSQQYWTRVFEPSLEEWQRGITPNPDVPCNKEIKFGALMDVALSGPNQWLVTGHYARVHRVNLPSGGTRCTLVKAVDSSKDQTYFLSSISQTQLSRGLFPLGNYLKRDVREMASKLGLPTADRPESMGLCFVGQKEGHIDRFISQYLPPNPGPIVDLKGNTIGQHQGLWSYTIGQGARIPGQPTKMFVAAKNIERNTIVAVPGSHHPALYCKAVQTTSWNWISGEPPCVLLSGGWLEADSKICYGDREEKCTVVLQGEGVLATFANPVRGVAPGQYAVLYSGEQCLGSGKIIDTTPVDPNLDSTVPP
ncbi:hypothetical protein FRB99_001678 [Tulasnella sp. 403]|nr:hypothetical protein FRB99_001678 [Tulasnella sp. 403]